MDKFNNIQTFLNINHNDKIIPKEIIKLLLFTSKSKLERDIKTKSLFFKDIKKITNTKYIFNYNSKNYLLEVFSDYELQKIDKKTLESSKRTKMSLLRTLKLACSLDLVNPRVIIGNSILDAFNLLIMFQDNGIDKVIDYGRNIIMNKDDYYEIFNYYELNILDKFDLYNIYFIINKLDDHEHIYEYLIFTKEIFNELSKNENFKFLTKKYNKNGFNMHNYLLFGNDSDCLFFQKEDIQMKYENLVKELDEFTENPTIKSKHISHNNTNIKYKLKEWKFGNFTFNLLSDMIIDKKTKEILLSKERYQECHNNSIMIANALKNEEPYIVGGIFKINENNYLNHSWVEIEQKNIVIDFNHNIIMNRDKYYKFFEAKPITKTLVSEMENIIQTVIYEADLNIHCMLLNYFGKEFMRDLIKNEKILKKEIINI